MNISAGSVRRLFSYGNEAGKSEKIRENLGRISSGGKSKFFGLY